MKYRIVGADRKTGEDVELTVDAQTEHEAFDKANRKDILVANLAILEPAATLTAVKIPPQTHREITRTQSPRRITSPIRRVAIVVFAIGAAVGILYVAMIRPANQKTKETLTPVPEQNKKTNEMAERNDAFQLEILKRQQMVAAINNRADLAAFSRYISNDHKLSAQEAIAADPIVGPLVKSNKPLETMLTGDVATVNAILSNTPEAQVALGDRMYIRAFTMAIVGLADSSNPGTFVVGPVDNVATTPPPPQHRMTRSEAIDADPFMSSFVGQYPALKNNIMKNYEAGLEPELEILIATGKIRATDRKAILRFAQDIQSLPE